jgi:phosphatidylinositol phospholipase C delta
MTAVNIESIRELRFASDARAFREQFKVAPDSEPRWITIIYTTAGKYKVLHLVALTQGDFKLWRQTLSTLYDQRKELMGGLDQMRKRHSVWLKQHWSNADADADQRLSLKDVAALCRNLNISAADRDIQTNFERADAHRRGFLDFADFQVFVKHLRRRPEIEKVMLSVAGNTDSVPLANFKCFLKTTQRVRAVPFVTYPFKSATDKWVWRTAVYASRCDSRRNTCQVLGPSA